MAKTDFQSVDEYIAAQHEAVQPFLQQVRTALRESLPEAEEVISYQIAAFKQGGKAFIYFAGYKNHYGVYPASKALLDELGEEGTARLEGKATLRFSLTEPVPVDLIQRIGRFRANEVAQPKRK